MGKPLRVAILGATGVVGQEFLRLLQERQFPLADLKLLASPNSAGKVMPFGGDSVTVEAVSAQAFANIDLVLGAAEAAIAKQWAPIAVDHGAIVIDNSSAFRLDPQVPLVIPEVNPVAAQMHQGIIANPNCSTIIMCVAIYPLHQISPIQRIIVATYQSASGAGAAAMQELEQQTQAVLAGQPAIPQVFPFPIAFNLFPHNSPIQETFYCQEEMKMVLESRKIMNVPELRVTATCIRVPILRAHSEAINLEFNQPFEVSLARQCVQKAPGITLIEDWDANRFPMPIDVSGKDDVAVGRIRQDISHPNCLELWTCGDQIRKGAALNAVQIAELLQA